jgi:hypothetical protein
VGAVRRGRCEHRDTMPPTSVRLTHRALEGVPAAPSSPLFAALQGQTVTSGRREHHPRRCQSCAGHPHPLQRHVVHYYNHSNAVRHVRTGRHHACYCTPYGPKSTAPSSPPGDAPVNHYAFILEAPLFKYRACHSAATGSRARQDGRHLHGTVHHTSPRS